MPAINAAASPAPVVSAPPSANNGPNAASASAGDGQEGSAPFAAVLKQQMADAPAAKLPAVKPDAEFVAQVDLSQEDPDLSAILPMLMEAAGLAPAATAGDAAGLSAIAGKKTAGQDPEETVLPELALALPAAPLAANPQVGPANASADAAAKAAAMPAASSPAILAAASDAASRPAAESGAKEGFDALLAGAQDANATPLAHAQAASVAKHETPPAAARIETPVGAAGWDTEIGDRLVWMAGRQDSRAELVLTPPQLGRIEISLSMSGDQASATFVSASPAVREALENALPRLREILAEAGVTLGQTQVGSESPGQSAHGRENGDNPSQKALGAFGTAGVAPLATGSGSPWIQSGRGMVDVFA